MNNFKLIPGDTVKVVAPSFSFEIISEEVKKIANERFLNLGLNLEFGDHTEEVDAYSSSSIASRISDLHDAYKDKDIKAIFAVIGGYNSNQLLPYLDWTLIKNNPKPLLGYSDTTALQNAIYAKTGNISYSSPAYSTFGQKLYFDYTCEYFKKAVMEECLSFEIEPSDEWTDDLWFLNQKERIPHKNEGWTFISSGDATGVIIGGNLSTLVTLFGTEFMPDLTDKILFLEDDETSDFSQFDRLFQSLVLQPNFSKVKGLVLGRFQIKSDITDDKLKRLISTRPELKGIPIIANVDFGHTSPIITYPIGGSVEIISNKDSGSIKIFN